MVQLTLSDSPSCPQCDGQGELLGTLGNLDWHRCIHCGIDYATIHLTEDREDGEA